MNENIYNFNDDIRISDVIDEEVINQFIKKNVNANGVEIQNVKKDQKYRDIDIDYIIKNNNIKVSFEIKSDFYETGNLFMEIYSCKETKTLGCFLKTKCDCLLYYFAHSNMIYYLNRKCIDYLVSNYDTIRKDNYLAFKDVWNVSRNGKLIHGVGLLISRKWLKENLSKFGLKIIHNVIDKKWFVQNSQKLSPKLNMIVLNEYEKYWTTQEF